MKETIQKLRVRLAEPADAEAIVAMARRLAAVVDDPPPDVDRARLVRDATGPRPWFECFVAESGRKLVGYVLVCRGFEAHTGRRRLWIGDLYVDAAVQRAGAGRALISAIAAHALELGCDEVYWELWRPNREGRAFYERIGAEEVGDLAIMRLGRERLSALAAAGKVGHFRN